MTQPPPDPDDRKFKPLTPEQQETTYGIYAPGCDNPEILLHLGRIAATWASADQFLVELLYRLLNDDPAAEIIYFSLNSFKARLDVITNLVTELMDTEDARRDHLLTVLNRLNHLNDTRNELLHSAM